MDRRDIIGFAGLALIDVGVWQLAGPAWASVIGGVQLICIYALLERVASRRR